MPLNNLASAISSSFYIALGITQNKCLVSVVYEMRVAIICVAISVTGI